MCLIEGDMLAAQPINNSSSENLLAAVSHFFGFVVALIIWAFEKDKSRFIRFQAIQAMAFDLLASVLIFFVELCMIGMLIAVLGFGTANIAIFNSPDNPTTEPVRGLISAMQGLPFVFVFIIALFGGAIFIARLIAAIQTLRGINFRYPWLGPMIEGFLESQSNRSMEQREY